MGKQFIKVRMLTSKGYKGGYIDINKVIAFRECEYDCNVTIIYTKVERFSIYMKYMDFRKELDNN